MRQPVRQAASAGSVGRLSRDFAENSGSFGNTERGQDAVVSRDAGPRRGPGSPHWWPSFGSTVGPRRT
jgi:hypothetical protein